jgi:hypothetical protein
LKTGLDQQFSASMTRQFLSLFLFPCFSSGYFTNATSGGLAIDLLYAYEFDTIQLCIDIYKDERSATLCQFLEITQGAPPTIDPNICVDNCRVSILAVLC